MIAADTSTWIAFFQGESGQDLQILDTALEDKQVLMPSAVIAEVLSDPKLPDAIASSLTDIPPIETSYGYWERVGALRAADAAGLRLALP